MPLEVIVLGPRLFIMYAADLADNVKEHKVNLHGYADDTQLYIHCQPDETAAAVAVLERCIEDVDDWMSANRLKLKVDKTELLWVGSKYNLSKLNGSGPSLQLKSSTVNSRTSTCACAWCSVLVGSESRQAHFLCQQFLLPPASPTTAHPAFA